MSCICIAQVWAFERFDFWRLVRIKSAAAKYQLCPFEIRQRNEKCFFYLRFIISTTLHTLTYIFWGCWTPKISTCVAGLQFFCPCTRTMWPRDNLTISPSFLVYFMQSLRSYVKKNYLKQKQEIRFKKKLLERISYSLS